MTSQKIKLAVFVSHGGSNFQALVDACKARILDAEILLLICNNPKAYVIERAKAAKIKTYLIKNRDLDQECEILEILENLQIDFLILAGYMKKIPLKIIEAFPNKILNIHPSLLPKFGGKGMYGLHVHQAVIDAKEVESGVTIHLVTGDYDQGKILAQEVVKVDILDTAETLQAKILKIEHLLYPKTVNNYIKSFKC
jgi:phosphoribosylglycinamide formyltransferase-1